MGREILMTVQEQRLLLIVLKELLGTLSWKDSLSSRSNELILRQTHIESSPRRLLLTLLRHQLHHHAAYHPFKTVAAS